MHIHYLSFYVDEHEAPDRDAVVSVQRKVRYITDCLKSLGCDVTIVSSSLPANGVGSARRRDVRIDEREDHVYLPIALSSVKGGTSQHVRHAIQDYVSSSVGDGDVLLVYHSVAYIPLYGRWGSSGSNYKFVLELNDRYSFFFAGRLRRKLFDLQERSGVKKANGYILASRWLGELVRPDSEFVVNYGDASVCPQGAIARGEGPYRAVYAGVVEMIRRAAFVVADSALYLPDDVELHIAGFGRPEALSELRERVELNNRDPGHARIVFHGSLAGAELDEFLLSADVALNAHSYPKEEEWQAKYSFPSKIPFYCGHGLHVITSSEQVFSVSDFHPCLRYFENGDSESLASAILAYRSEGYDGVDPREIVRSVDSRFREGIASLLGLN